MDPELPLVLDEQVLEDLRSFQEPGEPDFVAEIVEIFVTDMPELFQAMETALVSHDTAALQRAAHTLKGSAGNLGAVALASTAKELELLARAGTIDGAVELVVSLKTGFQHVQVALRHYQQSCSA